MVVPQEFGVTIGLALSPMAGVDARAWVLLCAASIDYLIGDPVRWLHPVQVMGWVISAYTQSVWRWSPAPWLLRGAGVGLAVLLVLGSAALGGVVVAIAQRLHPILGGAVESVLLASCLAARSLRQAAAAVLHPLQAGDLAQARSRLSQYVGRDTANLSTAEILRAVLETVAENSVDGVMAPLFWAIVGSWTPWGSVPFALGFKAASTLDSMVGYTQPPYRELGWCSAKLDDLLTWIPCRLSVLTLALLSGRAGPVWRICRRDGPQDPSPNSGWSEAAYAAVLGVQLGGVNWYQGVRKVKPRVGEVKRPIDPRVIQQALNWTRSLVLVWLSLVIAAQILLRSG
jgi:adenosylcobinamide-phosphate synthase